MKITSNNLIAVIEDELLPIDSLDVRFEKGYVKLTLEFYFSDNFIKNYQKGLIFKKINLNQPIYIFANNIFFNELFSKITYYEFSENTLSLICEPKFPIEILQNKFNNIDYNADVIENIKKYIPEIFI